MKTITKIEAPDTHKAKKLRVAAYARVSTSSDEQLISLDAQKNHYEVLIRSQKDWEFAGLYFDEGISGTKMAKRDCLLALLDDCGKGLIDYIIVKSISRFSRNTVDSIETVRRLCDMGIYIFFEKENIDTGKMEGELLLSILSSLAESESRSISDNETWSIKRRFMNGTYKISYPPYGYDYIDGEMVVNEKQSKVVRWIFGQVLSGNSTAEIARKLNEEGVATKRGGSWTSTTINGMIRNEKYTGDVIFQKSYSDERFARHRNNGERDQYYVTDHHEAIISHEDYEAANAILDRNGAEKGIHADIRKYQNRYCFSGKIICGNCGAVWKRRKISGYFGYACTTHLADKDACGMKSIREDSIMAAFTTMLNKLIFSHRQILKPYLESLKTSSSDDSLHRIQQIQTLLAQNTEKRETLTMLMTQGIIDPVLYSQETNELLSQADSFRDEIEALKNEVSGDVNKVTETTALIHFAEKSAMLQEFDKDLFDRYVKRIIVHSRNDIRFELKCGLTLRERK